MGWYAACCANAFMSLELLGSGHELLQGAVREGLPALHRELSERERTLPRHVVRELEGFLACGDPREGFAFLRCTDCEHACLVTFSCKGRGFCPKCCGRRMSERAAHWVDRVIPKVATRQWVLTNGAVAEALAAGAEAGPLVRGACGGDAAHRTVVRKAGRMR